MPGPYELHSREYYTYQLRGVVVHTGTANQGHYFSYIRDPDLGAAAAAAVQQSQSSHSGAANNSSNSGAAAAGTRAASRAHDGGRQTGDIDEGMAVDGAEERPDGVVDSGASGAGGLFSEGSGCPGDKKGGGVGGVVGTKGVEEKQMWCEFNDTIVKEWEVNGRRDGPDGGGTRIGGLEIDCFGGQQTMQVSVAEFYTPLEDNSKGHRRSCCRC